MTRRLQPHERGGAARAILLGYEAGTGEPVYVPLHHLVVTGTTQLSGKTTTLEALISRSALTSIAFRTKRGEANFQEPGVHVHEPYFRERADWRYVAALLEATMQERMKFERSWIINASKGAKSLRDVLDNVTDQLETARGLSQSVLTNLHAYLEIVVPQIEATPFAKTLSLRPGLNVMDLVDLPDELQALVIASTLEAVQHSARNTIVVLPEAWRFVPEGRGSPVKQPLERIARQGAAVGVYVFLDSQDITGVDKKILKNVDTWILGRQREVNEVTRAIAQLPLGKAQRPKPEDVMRLPLGHFIVATQDEVRTVYVQPAWLPRDEAIQIAKNGQRRRAPPVAAPHPKASRAPRATAAKGAKPTDDGAAPVRYELDVETLTPNMTVRERVVHLTATSGDDRGRVAMLITEDFFDAPRGINDAIREFHARGWGAKVSGGVQRKMTRLLDDFAEMGFLRRENGYVLVPDAKKRITRKKEKEDR